MPTGLLRASRIAWRGETPDHASIWRFSQTTEKLGLSAALLAETNRQLDALGLMVKRIALVDVVKRPTYGDGGLNRRDPDARVTDEVEEDPFRLQGASRHLGRSGRDRSPIIHRSARQKR